MAHLRRLFPKWKKNTLEDKVADRHRPVVVGRQKLAHSFTLGCSVEEPADLDNGKCEDDG
jgi:hypothetical protein